MNEDLVLLARCVHVLAEDDPMRLECFPILLRRLAGDDIANDTTPGAAAVKRAMWPLIIRARLLLSRSALAVAASRLLLVRREQQRAELVLT